MLIIKSNNTFFNESKCFIFLQGFHLEPLDDPPPGTSPLLVTLNCISKTFYTEKYRTA